MDKDLQKVFSLVWMVAVAVLCVLATWDGVRSGMRRDAIEANVAEWRIDPTTGAKEFVYIKCECEEQADGE